MNYLMWIKKFKGGPKNANSDDIMPNGDEGEGGGSVDDQVNQCLDEVQSEDVRMQPESCQYN